MNEIFEYVVELSLLENNKLKIFIKTEKKKQTKEQKEIPCIFFTLTISHQPYKQVLKLQAQWKLENIFITNLHQIQIIIYPMYKSWLKDQCIMHHISTIQTKHLGP